MYSKIILRTIFLFTFTFLSTQWTYSTGAPIDNQTRHDVLIFETSLNSSSVKPSLIQNSIKADEFNEWGRRNIGHSLNVGTFAFVSQQI